MVEEAAFHALSAEMHVGILTLAAFSIIITLSCQVVVRWESSMPRSLVRLAMAIRGYTEAASFVATIAGVLMLLVSAFTGMEAWNRDALLADPVVRNKIMLTVFALVMWMGVLGIRAVFGRRLWNCTGMVALYVLLALAAYGLIAVTGSLGSHLTNGWSALDWLWDLLPVDPYQSFQLPITWMALLVLISLGGVLMALLYIKWYSLAEPMEPSSCQKGPTWTEPSILDAVDEVQNGGDGR
jgi:hypothetical protein